MKTMTDNEGLSIGITEKLPQVIFEIDVKQKTM
jgi:hypothetical protein